MALITRLRNGSTIRWMENDMDERKYQYRCDHSDCEYHRQIVVQAVRPGLFPSCHACGHALTLLWGTPPSAADCGGYRG